jgi:hypothetical protein
MPKHSFFPPPHKVAYPFFTTLETSAGRSIQQADIVASHHHDSIACASVRDFTLGRIVPVGDGELPKTILPYCLDVPGCRSFYLGGLSADEAAFAPFYYLYARRKATQVFIVPWNVGPLTPAAQIEPVLLFSPGRCGSTLLTRILAEAKVPTVSEPDFYTQYTAGYLFDGAPDLYRGPVKTAMHQLEHDLMSALTDRGTVVIKLRSDVCLAARPLLADAGRRPKTLFMIRNIESWARSSLRVFDYEPDQTLARYLLALKCFAWQQQRSDCLAIRYETLIASPEATCARLALFLNCSIAPDAIVRAFAQDAQQGTPLERGKHTENPHHQTKLKEIHRLWNEPKYTALRTLAASIA